MNRKTFRLVVVLGAIAIIGIVLIQIYWVRQLFNIQEEQFDVSIKVALTKVAEQMYEFNQSTLPNESTVNQRASNYYVVNINDVIDANVLEHFLTTEFEKRNLDLDFEYSIYDCSSDKMVYGDYISFSNKQEKPPKLTELPKYDEFIYYFGIYFPTKSTYLISKMQIWIFSSFVMLIVIAFYAYALFVMMKQKRLSEFQKDFIDNMTHEFKTPISTISISADVLSQPEIVQKPEKLQNYATIIKSEAGRLNNQVEKVLQMSKIEKDTFELKKEKLDLHKIVKNALANLEGGFKQKNCQIEQKLLAKKSFIEADKVHLKNTIYNLLDNALKYSKENPKIILQTQNQKNKLILSISDNGIGMDKTMQKRVFDKFFRVPTDNIHDVKGFGIGLNYVKTIVEAHGWEIELESKLGIGTTFKIYF